MLKKKTIEGFLKELSSDKPVPGGGSVAALSGAMAVALCLMVAKLSQDPEAKICIRKAVAFKRVLVNLVDKDAEAFEKVMKAYKLPKTTEKEKAKRQEEIKKALKHAAEVPLETARYSYEVLKLVEILAEKGNPRAISDVGTAAMLCGASIKSALFNVNINLALLKDDEFKEEIEKGIEIIVDYPVKVAEISNEVHKKIASL